MQRSTDRILTTHTGSLPRPADLVPLLLAQAGGEAVDAAQMASRVREAVAEVVRKQVEVGLDVVNDGEVGKVGYSTYVASRLTGFEGVSRGLPSTARDRREFPDFFARLSGAPRPPTPACTGPIRYRDLDAVQADLANLAAATAATPPTETFVTAASPGVIAYFLRNEYYPSHEAYIAALADAMKSEYDAIHRAGFLLQLDCPDLAFSWNSQFVDLGMAEFKRHITLHIAALNHALADIPPDRLRLHLCWGNYEGPHNHDIPLREIIELVYTARPAAISFEGANPRHEHEWNVFAEMPLPDDKVILPGILDSTTNFIEHPELVAQRIVRYASVVGRERVIAGTDCGFATFATSNTVDPAIAWAKLQALAEGARLASEQLW
jgi:5-methyltetrahydropteroyltriglutamate--homocysteine methyltransferase